MKLFNLRTLLLIVGFGAGGIRLSAITHSHFPVWGVQVCASGVDWWYDDEAGMWFEIMAVEIQPGVTRAGWKYFSDVITNQGGAGTDVVFAGSPGGGYLTTGTYAMHWNESITTVDTVGWFTINLLHASFGNNFSIYSDSDSEYGQPHFTTGGDAKPIGFVSGLYPSAGVDWSSSIDSSYSSVVVKMRASGTGGLSFPSTSTTHSSGTVIYVSGLYSSNAFAANTVKYYNPLTVTWEASTDGGSTWYSAGSSSNRAYVTFASPGVRAWETVIHRSTDPADGETTAAGIVSYVFAQFQNLNVQRYPNGQMTYWANGNNLDAQETQALISNGNANGNCESWSALFRDMLLVQGLSADRIVVQPTFGRQVGVLTNNWSFSGPSGSDPSFPYLRSGDMSRTSAAAAQGNSSPPAQFNAHWITLYNGSYYDPSYGNGPYSTLKSYEDATFPGYIGDFDDPWTKARPNSGSGSSEVMATTDN